MGGYVLVNGPVNLFRFLAGIVILFCLAPPAGAATAVPGTIRVALLRQAESLSFQTDGTYQLIDRSNDRTIMTLGRGETVKASLAGGRIVLQKQGTSGILGSFSQGVLIQEGALSFQATVLSGSGIKTEVISAAGLVAVSSAGKRVGLENGGEAIARGAFGTASLSVRNGKSEGPSLFSLNQGTGYVRYRGNLEIRPENGKLAAVNSLNIEDYLRGVVPSEMPASWPFEALKAQAVAARNYALQQAEVTRGNTFNVFSDQYSQVYGGYDAETTATDRAVEETRGMVMLSRGSLIDAFFHSCSGGYTENSEDVWRESLPYIRSKADPYDKNDRYYNWKVTCTAEKLRDQLNQSGLKFKTVTDIQELARTASGARVEKIAVSGTGQDGKPLREEVANADGVRIALGLKSAPSAIEKTLGKDKKLSAVTLKGSGWGHGLGMSQWGASGMAKKGYNYQDILKYYYTGISLTPDYGRSR
jgi:stage II sporulation protein D